MLTLLFSICQFEFILLGGLSLGALCLQYYVYLHDRYMDSQPCMHGANWWFHVLFHCWSQQPIGDQLVVDTATIQLDRDICRFGCVVISVKSSVILVTYLFRLHSPHFQPFFRHRTLLPYMCVTAQAVLRSIYGNVKLTQHVLHLVIITSFQLTEPPDFPLCEYDVNHLQASC